MRRLKFTIGIIIAVVLVLGIGGYFAYTTYTKTVTDLRAQVTASEDEINNLLSDIEVLESQFIQAVVFTKDLKAGTPITEEDLVVSTMCTESIPVGAYTETDKLIGKMTKIDTEAFTCVTPEMVYEWTLMNNERELDVVLDEIPIALEVGDYVDVHVSFPLGQDYVAMNHKRVLGIFDKVLKIIVSPDDIYSYESMKTDIATYKATKIYAIKYVEAGIQASAENWYPVSLDIMNTRMHDPNIDTSDWNKDTEVRQQLETQLADDEENEEWPGNRVEKLRTVSSKSSISSSFEKAKSNYEKLQEEKEKAAAKEAAKNKK